MGETTEAAGNEEQVRTSTEPVHYPAPCPPRPPMPAHFRASFYWPQLLKDHPALGVSLAYAILTVAGAGYAWFYYFILRVNFLQLTDAADFLVIIFQHPFVPLLLLLPYPLFNVYMAVTYRLVWWLRWRSRWLWKKLPDPAGPPKWGDRVQRILGYLFFALYAMAGMEFYAMAGALKVRAGEGRQIALEIRPSARSAAMDFDRKNVLLLGTTTHFMIVYDLEEKRAWSLPHDSIARILHPRRSRDVKADEAEAAAEREDAVPAGGEEEPVPEGEAAPAGEEDVEPRVEKDPVSAQDPAS